MLFRLMVAGLPSSGFAEFDAPGLASERRWRTLAVAVSEVQPLLQSMTVRLLIAPISALFNQSLCQVLTKECYNTYNIEKNIQTKPYICFSLSRKLPPGQNWEGNFN